MAISPYSGLMDAKDTKLLSCRMITRTVSALFTFKALYSVKIIQVIFFYCGIKKKTLSCDMTSFTYKL